jgi:hypothetical protein
LVVGAIEAVADGIAGSIFSSKLELEEALSFGKSSSMSVSDGEESIDGEKPLQAFPLSSW